MLKTRVGYAGGEKDKPTYRSIGDHTEAIQIEFDPDKISFADLLDVFWASHDPFGGAWSTQYKAVLWTHGKEQARIAKASLDAVAKARGRAPTTKIVPAPRFWIAEDYHQKYYLRGRKALLSSVLASQPAEALDEDTRIRESTVTARVNGWLAGHGKPARIEADVKAFGFDEKTRALLAKALGTRVPALCR